MFDTQTLKKFEFLLLASSKEYTGQTSGARRNSKLGGGVEFVDYRDYVYGDDLRNLDWNVYARLETPFIKQFQEEGNLPVYCFLDASRSMGADAAAKKFEYAKNLVGALGYISLARFDSFGVFTFADKLGPTFPLARGKGRFLELARFLDGVAPREGVTDANGSIREALAKIRKPGMALIVSDCYDPNGLDASLERLLARRFDPVVLQIYDESESNPQDRGDYVFEDAESGATRTFTVDENTLKQYRAAFQNFIATVRTSCVKRGVRFYSTSIGVPFETFLLNVTCDMTNRAVK